jgi:hypothetical protein
VIRFHKKDAYSSYIINQREQDIKEKWTKYEKYNRTTVLLTDDSNDHFHNYREKQERKNDPNVEYIDIDDFKYVL